MPTLEYFLICESMSTDQETNRVSLFNVLEDLQVRMADTSHKQQVPVAQLVAVACFNRELGDEDQDFQATLRIHAPGQESKDLPLNFTMERNKKSVSFFF